MVVVPENGFGYTDTSNVPGVGSPLFPGSRFFPSEASHAITVAMPEEKSDSRFDSISSSIPVSGKATVDGCSALVICSAGLVQEH